MRYLVSIKQEQRQKMTPYIKEHFTENWAMVEVEDSQIERLKSQVEVIEPDFEIQLGHTFWYDLGVLANEPILLVTIGKYCLCKDVQYTYELKLRKWEEQSLRTHRAIWIHGYSKSDHLYASHWIGAVDQFYRLSKHLNYPLIIIQNIESVLPYFNEDSKAKTCIEEYLKQQSSLMIRQIWNPEQIHFLSKRFKVTSTHMLSTEASSYRLQREIQLWLQSGQEEKQMTKKRMYLYEDVFYQQIPLEQKIYVPIYGKLDHPENLKMHTISIGQEDLIIYESRRVIDRYFKTIEKNIFPYLEQPIVTRVSIQRNPLEKQKAYEVIDSKCAYKGRGVYIGIVTEEGIDCTHPCLKKQDGTTRISNYWIQEEGEQGKNYRIDDLNAGLNNPEVIPELSWINTDNDSTTLLIEAGGRGEAYESIALEAEFLVAQIQKAPVALQNIYGGIVSQKAVLMADVLIATQQLIEKARLDHKPLVLIIPYQTNLSAHDGTGFYESILNELGKQPGCTIIVPVGEEGNKQHHHVLGRDLLDQQSIRIKADKDTTYLVGELYFKQIPKRLFNERIEIYKAFHKEQSIPLYESGIYPLEDSTIYTTGLVDDDRNGMRVIRFAIRNMHQGEWYIKGLPKRTYQNAQINLYLAGEALNPNVRCIDASPFGTLGSNAALEAILSVGGYDEKSSVGLISCGKGAEADDRAQPFCLLRGKEKYPGIIENWYSIEGSMVSAALMAGVVALLYERGIYEEEIPYANTLRMKQWLLDSLKIELDTIYPNATQGYGIFSLDALTRLSYH